MSKPKIFASLLIGFSLIYVIYYIDLNHYDESNLMKSSDCNGISSNKSAQIFCIILTRVDSTKAKAVLDSWAKYCDEHRFVVNSSKSLPSQFKVIVSSAVVDTYDKLTDKVYASFVDIYEHFDSFDWYLKADDDTFVFVRNLRRFLARQSPCLPNAFGYVLRTRFFGKQWLSGGAGYVMSREAFERLYVALKRGKCMNTGVEDKDVSECLTRIRVRLESGVDELGRERFHP